MTGDATQVDVAEGRSGVKGLESVLGGVEDLAFVHLSSADVVRHRIVADIVEAYEREAETERRRPTASVRAKAGGAGRWLTPAVRRASRHETRSRSS